MKTYRQQKGMALILSLALLLVMSMLGIAGMQAAVMEQNMASNAQQHMETFQAAENGLETTAANLTDINTLGTAREAGSDGVNSSLDSSVDGAHYTIATTTNTQFVGENSISLNNSISEFNTAIFQLTAQSTLGVGGARSVHTSNVSILVRNVQ